MILIGLYLHCHPNKYQLKSVGKLLFSLKSTGVLYDQPQESWGLAEREDRKPRPQTIYPVVNPAGLVCPPSEIHHQETPLIIWPHSSI